MHHVDVHMEAEIYGANNRLAEHNAEHFKAHNVRAFDLLGAIGSGKTSLIEKLVPELKSRGKVTAAIAGDVYGDDDFQRIIKTGIIAFNANTGKECHLDAHLVHHALDHMDLDDVDIVFIENVGNMVCPTDFKLGAEKRIVVISTTEGDDVVNKHPMMFRDCQIAIINKVDLAEAVGCNVERMIQDIKRYNPEMLIIKTNLKKGEGVKEIADVILA
ncbi:MULTISPECIES: hydrogenase nickel incorporation protein HypB [Methanocorpusculum]|jgi:hydrogenase nickel incorporation protein HypB|uniref:hydrogenase nickel incorporation protein HypB n=1 Tax=Methanocorpusculum TaxID=2192 RepID=UPI0005B255F2|nr:MULTISPECIES: hydrogenase nickel incorporation protein HypB [Methanocorpusculum]MDD4423266.1 hydrogenase nickel incorporation protein HypB [Methanocorpusculum parvum]MDD2249349.1 hydrogenase nickel incorporation protein HypB [Methanocorpusculum sp.]MDD2802777.1 hydrogenase nickel incorporation protein HypB [Methanocorpusculum sp.]MDD3046838.1 hydrogenase nickel incorporation protein HypB [Methanocorpusculum sp.]MDD3912129.1 hydrogenase nickel incorporation protein HypB [Methanocorpusculum s